MYCMCTHIIVGNVMLKFCNCFFFSKVADDRHWRYLAISVDVDLIDARCVEPVPAVLSTRRREFT